MAGINTNKMKFLNKSNAETHAKLLSMAKPGIQHHVYELYFEETEIELAYYMYDVTDGSTKSDGDYFCTYLDGKKIREGL